MPAKIVLSVLVLTLVAGGTALRASGGVVASIFGVLLVIAGAALGWGAVQVLRDPQGAADRLQARRAVLESRTADGEPATATAQELPDPAGTVLGEVGPGSAQATQPQAQEAAPANREQRRAAARSQRQRGDGQRRTQR